MHLEKYIAERTGMPLRKITDSSSLFHDLNIAGIDGFDLLNDLASKFEFKLGKFDAERYFGSDRPLDLFLLVLDLIRGRNRRTEISRLEIGHLKAVIKNKEWFEPSRTT
jgi:Protein of unknown function (DUF1493)